MEENKKLLPDEGKDIIPNEERKKFGLAPIPGGDVAIRSVLEDYKEFAENLYMKIRSQCRCYGELKAQIQKMRRDLRWEHGDDLGARMEFLLQKEIDSALETLPIQDFSGNAETD